MRSRPQVARRHKLAKRLDPAAVARLIANYEAGISDTAICAMATNAILRWSAPPSKDASARRPREGGTSVRWNLRITASVVAVASTAFVTVSWALTSASPAPDLPSWLPAATLPVVEVPLADQLAINDQLSLPDARRYGIMPSSYARARVLARTELGPLYVIPGATGVCLALRLPAVACTDNLSSHGPAVVALLVPNDAQRLIGGGLMGRSADRVLLISATGSRIRAHPVPGGFTVNSSDGITASPENPVSFVPG